VCLSQKASLINYNENRMEGEMVITVKELASVTKAAIRNKSDYKELKSHILAVRKTKAASFNPLDYVNRNIKKTASRVKILTFSWGVR